MANDVFANMMEVSCKAAQGKSICAFPDVCFTPPQTPATPPGVPIPYPNTGMASDCTSGSKSVKISGQEVMLKNKSYFKRSMGDEAGCAPKKGLITSKNMGKVYFNMWSMDVKVEGENVVRNLDITTHNHASVPGNSPTWPYMDQVAISLDHPCVDDIKKEHQACSGKSKSAQCKSKECQAARKCMLTAYKPKRCCKGQTGHHLVEVHSFCKPGKPRGRPLDQFKNYNQNKAPVVCAACKKGSRYDKEHGRLHAYQGTCELDAISKASDSKMAWTYKDARQAGVEAHSYTFPGCKPACIEAQLDAYHKQDSVGIKDEDPVRTETPPLQEWQKKAGREAVDAARQAAVGPSVGA